MARKGVRSGDDARQRSSGKAGGACPRSSNTRSGNTRSSSTQSGGTRTSRQSRRAKGPRRRGWRMFGKGLALLVWTAIAAAGVVAWHAYDLPDITRLEDAGTRRPGMTIRAADGTALARFGEMHGRAVRLADLPAHVGHAVLATEDRRFYDHFGIDVIGVARAAAVNLRAGSLRQGGSTLTQQLAKNLFLTREKTLSRKIQEALLALWLEWHLTKDQILTIYLNRVYFGAGAYGIDAAAQRYFGRPAETLMLYQSAVLAGLLKAPSRDNPLADPVRAADRANQVLANMVDAGWLDRATMERLRSDRVAVHSGGAAGDDSRYFVDWVRERIDSILGHVPDDLEVLTTLDPLLQRHAEAAMEGALAGAGPGSAVDPLQGALVAMSPDGAVRAMIGGRHYRDSQFNRATQALRQPGSAFKLFVYLAGLDAGLEPDSMFEDRPVSVEGWAPRNATRTHRGAVTMREAVVRSLNGVAVQVAERAGRQRVIDWARRLAITTPMAATPSLALGAHEVTLLELTAAYAALAAEGRLAWPHAVREVRTRSGDVLYRRDAAPRRRVLPPGHVAAMNDMLAGVLVWGTGKAARLDRPAAGKTGTSQDNRDAWFVGYTADLVAGVWVGTDRAAPMPGIAGGNVPARAWRSFMEAASRGQPVRPLSAAPAAPADGPVPVRLERAGD